MSLARGTGALHKQHIARGIEDDRSHADEWCIGIASPSGDRARMGTD